MMLHSLSTETELCELVAGAAAQGRKLELRGGGSKTDIGNPERNAEIVDMRGFSGIVDYDPAELVLTARAGTQLAEIQELVAQFKQMLAFDPYDHAPLFGRPGGAATIGGVIAAGIAGSRRLSCGGARDHLLGFVAVSGRGERVVGGAKVVKNVTGYDLPKLLAGSWGRLAALTEVTLKVLPHPHESVTRILRGHSAVEAHRVMAAAVGSQAAVAAAVHLPADIAGGDAITALRLDGVGPSLRARLKVLDELPDGIGRGEDAVPVEAEALWDAVRTLAPLGRENPLWRVNVPARAGPKVLAALRPAGATGLLDWAGGLVWLSFDGEPDLLRHLAAGAGGHAMLVRGPPDLRARTPIFQPQPPALAALETRVRRAFDPGGVFETGRFRES
jgi:glycolate oxidase FAD binding subunit